MNSIKINLTPDQFSNALRKLEHSRLIIDKDLEMSQEAEVVFYNNEDVRMTDLIEADETLTSSQKRINKERFKNQSYASNTAGSFVDAETGGKVLSDENGNYPEGVTIVGELEFWQTLPTEFFTGANLGQIAPQFTWQAGTTLAQLVYNGLQFSMIKMAERNRV